MAENNVFFLHRDARLCASWLHDKHAVTMPFEIEKLLSSAIQLNLCDTEPLLVAAKFDHPHLWWLTQSIEHAEWMFSYYFALSERIRNTFRREYRNHMAMQLFERYIKVFPRTPWVDPPVVVDADCLTDDLYESYRLYYMRCKIKVGSYKRSRMPYWLCEYLNEEPKRPWSGR